MPKLMMSMKWKLKWEWKQAKGGNSGLKYFVTEKGGSALGHEYQLIDETEHPDAKEGNGKRGRQESTPVGQRQ